MQKQKESASSTLRRRYIGEDPARQASLESERVNARVAQMIYDRRTAAGMSQKELAELIGTKQSVISRLEDADYEGHSLTMLQRIADVLDQRVAVQMTPKTHEPDVIRFVFREVVRSLRRKKNLTVDELAEKLELDREEIVAMERQEHYQPKPLVLYKLSHFHGIPQRQLAALAGAVSEVPPALREHASRFAAQSESFAKLTTEEKRTLDEFVKFLKTEA
jgi:transcriptional regulator with XRE-family HTH domain